MSVLYPNHVNKWIMRTQCVNDPVQPCAKEWSQNHKMDIHIGNISSQCTGGQRGRIAWLAKILIFVEHRHDKIQLLRIQKKPLNSQILYFILLTHSAKCQIQLQTY